MNKLLNYIIISEIFSYITNDLHKLIKYCTVCRNWNQIICNNCEGVYDKYLNFIQLYDLCKNGKTFIIRMLLSSGIHPDYFCYDVTCTLFMVIVGETMIKNKIDIIKLLIEFGTDLDRRYIFGDTALMVVIMRLNNTERYETVQLLIEKGAELNSQNKLGFTALMIAIISAKNNYDYEIIKLLINSNVDLNKQNMHGQTALTLAIINTHKEISFKIAKLLIESGANLNICDHKRRTPLMYTEIYLKNDIIQLLNNKK
jgi:ankyrin repeat protein